MSVEDELELVEKPKYVPYEAPGKDRAYRAVGTLYLEDIERIYRAIDSTLGKEKAKREQETERHESHQQWMAGTYAEMGRVYERQPLSDRLTDPLIQMRNEEYHYRSLEQVAQIPRVGFREFHLSSGFRGVKVTINPSQVKVETGSDDPEFENAFDRIHDIITGRQNRIVDFLLFHPAIIGIWIASLIFAQVIYTTPVPGIYPTSMMLFFYAGILSRIVYWFIYSRRKFVVIPRYERDARLSFMDKHGNTLQVLLAAASIAVAVVLWMFPREN